MTKRYIILYLILASVMGCNFSRQMLYYPQEISERRLRYIEDHFENVHPVQTESINGVKLHGWIIKKDLEQLPTIIYFGGNAEEVSLNIEDFVSMLPANVILFNYRGYGLSAGEPSEQDLKNDAEQIYDDMKTTYSLDADQVVTMGRSLGAGIAVHLAVQRNITRNILITPFDSMKEVAYDHFPNFLVNALLSDTYETIKISEQVKGRALLLVAEHDEVIFPKHAETLYRTMQCDKHLVYINRCGHNTISEREQYWVELKKFLQPNRK